MMDHPTPGTFVAPGRSQRALRADLVPIDQLRPHPSNPRRHNLPVIKRSLAALGQYRAIVVNEGTKTGRPNEILAGHGTVLAATELGWTDISVTFVDVDEETATNILLVDNRASDLADYDDRLLVELLSTLDDISISGYDAGALEELIQNIQPPDLPPDLDDDIDDLPDLPVKPISRRGDVWQLGPHRIMCGDARSLDDVRTLMAGTAIDLAFTSPPYADRREYDPDSDFRPVPPEEYVDWFEPVQANVRKLLAAHGSWFVNIKEHCEAGQRVLYVKDLTLAHVRRWGWMLVDELCWVDTKNGVPGGWQNRFKDAWEPVFHFALSGPTPITFNALANGTESAHVFQEDSPKSSTGSGLLGGKEHGNDYFDGIARPSNVIQIAASSDSNHSAAFPVALPLWFIRAYSNRGHAIFDPFAGSGTTIIAADECERVGYGMELSPAYCDVICRRWQERTGILPRKGSREVDFSEVETVTPSLIFEGKLPEDRQ